jgi:predicted AAA+ superfamily ATPase
MTQSNIKVFNTAGTCLPAEHSMIPHLGRVQNIMTLIDDNTFFVIHAPRQSGKTTFSTALIDEINSENE